MNKLFLSIIISLFVVQLGYSQRLSDWTDAANEAFVQKDYYSAYKYYGIALEYDEKQTDIWYQYAESARLFDIYTKAEMAYHRVLASADTSSFPLATLRLGEVSQRLGKYDQAIEMFQRFLDETTNATQKHKDIALRGIEDSSWAKDIVENQEDITIRNLTDSINSTYSDFGATLKGDTFYFSALKFVYEKDTVIPARPFSKIVQVVQEQHTPLDASINQEGQHTAFSAFNNAGTKVYYAKCEFEAGSQTDIICDLYVSDITPDGNWLPGQKLAINASGFTNTSPNVGYNRVSGKETLYFASDRDGGLGGLDIWFAPINEDGTLGEVDNLAAINTPEDEMSPFYSSIENTLYFGTNGRQTLGGYDIYSSRLMTDNWSEPVHLGAPVNSSYEDLYYGVFNDGETAYFSSKRPDSTALFWDETKETCCFDIYTYDKSIGIDLLVTTFNKLDNNELFGTTVSLYEILPNGEEVLVEQKENPDANDFNFTLIPGRKYKLKGEKDGFVKDIATIDLDDPSNQGKTNIEQELYLEPGVELLVTTFDNLDSLALNGVTVDLYEITPEGEEVLVDSATNPLGNDFSFTLAHNKKYVIKGQKDGYPIEIDRIDLTDPALAKLPQIDRKLYFGQELEVLVIDERTKEPLHVATVELYEIREGSEPVLLFQETNPTGNNFLFPLDLQKEYKLSVTRKGYEPKLDLPVVFDPALVKEAEGRITTTVELERGSLDEHLPLLLFFDNDHPNPRSYKRTTTLDYLTTNEAYSAKEEDFIKEAVEGLPKRQKRRAARQYEDFFNREVNKSKENLNEFTLHLLEFLETGRKFKVVLKGYASPRASTKYNEILSSRRNSSVVNHFKTCNNGIFMKYIKNGALTFEEETLGESTAAATISDKLEDKRGSIFSYVASVERRSEIVQVVENKN